VNNNDERDYAEEAANRAELEHLDDEPSALDMLASTALVVPAVVALVTNPRTPEILAAAAAHVRDRLGLDADPFAAYRSAVLTDAIPPGIDPAIWDEDHDAPGSWCDSECGGNGPCGEC
jgi:hypothetical protein